MERHVIHFSDLKNSACPCCSSHQQCYRERSKSFFFFQQIFLTDLFLLQSSLKTSSNKQVNKRSDIKMASSTAGNQNAGMIRTLTSNAPATFLPQSTPVVESKVTDTIQDKSGKHVKTINANEPAEPCSFKKCLIGPCKMLKLLCPNYEKGCTNVWTVGSIFLKVWSSSLNTFRGLRPHQQNGFLLNVRKESISHSALFIVNLKKPEMCFLLVSVLKTDKVAKTAVRMWVTLPPVAWRCLLMAALGRQFCTSEGLMMQY